MLDAKENALRFFSHEKTEYFPIPGEGYLNNVPINGFHERPAGGKGGKDWFGVIWGWKEGEPAPVPAPPFLLDDICDWEEVIKFPDLEAFDWKAAAKADRADVFDRENLLMYQMIHNGLVERLQRVMSFEDALCALLTDPDEVAAFFDALADYKCALVDKIAEHYRPDIICYHDDWGTQSGMFFSPDIWRELVKEPTKRIVDHVHSKGIKFVLHSDGLIKDVIPEVAQDVGVDVINLQAINDVPEMKKLTGDSISYEVYIDLQRYDAQLAAGTLTDESFRMQLREEILRNAEGGYYAPAMVLVDPRLAPAIDDVLHECQAHLRDS